MPQYPDRQWRYRRVRSVGRRGLPTGAGYVLSTVVSGRGPSRYRWIIQGKQR
ncbi:hypothetical protein [Leptothoe sp. PORK10 BA2]|uniref:hypothetical protein n=1 Tax=Leptothoe sp. PORK10 BA2 TaxID=3110254 RepID=UPI002B1EFD94|nr:hypothetical protein [Leptothoe sp. PORK10 BA2]MEA5466694.1 hypothetical protein [Leptothoe sp. PORK10 BA2]